MKTLALAIGLALAAPAAWADPHPQLVRSIEMRLAQHGLAADVSRFATPTVVELHFALSERAPWWEKRRRLLAILREPVLKEEYTR